MELIGLATTTHQLHEEVFVGFQVFPNLLQLLADVIDEGGNFIRIHEIVQVLRLGLLLLLKIFDFLLVARYLDLLLVEATVQVDDSLALLLDFGLLFLDLLLALLVRVLIVV